MATLGLAYAGGAIGEMIMPGIGGILGKGIGAIAGAFIDQKLFAPPKTEVDPSRYKVTTSTEGRPIPRLYGRARVGGTIIWSTYFLRQKAKGTKGMGSLFGSSNPDDQVDHYFANWAVALCEGPITRIGQVWVDGKPINLADYNFRLYYGTEDQLPDSLIVAKEGAANTPAYRGVAYLVFEGMDLIKFGNRLPQITVEVFRAIDDLEGRIQAVTMIPAAGEFCYDPQKVVQDIGYGITCPVNVNTNGGESDFWVSVGDLYQTLPNVNAVSLFVSWFGDDLRASHCTIQPKVDNHYKYTTPYDWKVANSSREASGLVSYVNGAAAYGGTPNDLSVFNAIKALKGDTSA